MRLGQPPWEDISCRELSSLRVDRGPGLGTPAASNARVNKGEAASPLSQQPSTFPCPESQLSLSMAFQDLPVDKLAQSRPLVGSACRSRNCWNPGLLAAKP